MAADGGGAGDQPKGKSGRQAKGKGRHPRLRRTLKFTGISLAAVLAILTGVVYYLAGFWLPPTKGWWANHLAGTFDDRPKGETVFYGASNFRLWKSMEADLAPYRVQNHGIGGATDGDLLKYADVLLYPFEPAVVFLQTGSNEYVLGDTYEEVQARRVGMYEEFLERLPEATIVAMSGVPMPGRAELWEQIDRMNGFLAEHCEQTDRMVFVDATALLTTADGEFRPELFRQDGVHLNSDGLKLWAGAILEVLSDLDAPRD